MFGANSFTMNANPKPRARGRVKFRLGAGLKKLFTHPRTSPIDPLIPETMNAPRLGIIRLSLAAVVASIGGMAAAQSPYQSSADFAKYAMKLRESAILRMEPQVLIPTTSRTLGVSGKYPWKTQIVTTTFWVGEAAGGNNPVHNYSSSWDMNWSQSFGGFDNPNPAARRNFLPAAFVPRQNPFYIALPYNDVTRGTNKPEAKVVIPWFREAFTREGQSVCRDRWIAVRSNSSSGKICYAQWSDCGPFRTDHWQYVFGNEKPKPNLNRGAGLDISPAVRDYLGINSSDVTDWKFVDFKDVPNGPWSHYGDNNHFVQRARGQERVVSSASAPPLPTRATTPVVVQEPTVVTKQQP